MIYENNILTEFEEKYAKDLVLCCFGEEGALYAEDFSFNEAHITKYNHNIDRNLEYIKNKHVVDIGSSTGIWAILMLLSGAEKVTCIEPRKQFCNGINEFAKMHNLPIKCINGFHTNIFDIKEKIDTVSMMSADDSINEMVYFLNSLRKISDYFLLKTTNYDDFVGENEIRYEFAYNSHHRSGFHIETDINSLDNLSYDLEDYPFYNPASNDSFVKDHSKSFEKLNEKRVIRYFYGKNFYDNIFDYLGYTILDKIIVDQVSNDDPYKCYSVKLTDK